LRRPVTRGKLFLIRRANLEPGLEDRAALRVIEERETARVVAAENLRTGLRELAVIRSLHLLYRPLREARLQALLARALLTQAIDR
jgi:hypothetical protein